MSRKSQFKRCKRKQKLKKHKAQKRKLALGTQTVRIEGNLYDADEIGAWLYHEAVKSKQGGFDKTTHLERLRREILHRWPRANEGEISAVISQAGYAADRIYAAEQVIVLG